MADVISMADFTQSKRIGVNLAEDEGFCAAEPITEAQIKKGMELSQHIAERCSEGEKNDINAWMVCWQRLTEISLYYWDPEQLKDFVNQLYQRNEQKIIDAYNEYGVEPR